LYYYCCAAGALSMLIHFSNLISSQHLIRLPLGLAAEERPLLSDHRFGSEPWEQLKQPSAGI
jgi:hypothetical protein